MKTLFTILALSLCLGAMGQDLINPDSVKGKILFSKDDSVYYGFGQGNSIQLFEAKYDTVYGVLIYYDTSLTMQADSCKQIRKAEGYRPAACPDRRRGSNGSSCLVFHTELDWQELRLELYSGEVIDRKQVISFHKN